MGVDGHCGVFEIFVQYDIGSFAADAGEFHEGFAIFRDLAFMFIDQNLCHGDDVFGLCVVEADGFDVAFKPVQTEAQHFFGGVGDFEQGFCGFVDADICGLGGEGDRDEKGIGVCPYQIALGGGVYGVKAGEKFVDVFFGHSFCVGLAHKFTIKCGAVCPSVKLLT